MADVKALVPILKKAGVELEKIPKFFSALEKGAFTVDELLAAAGKGVRDPGEVKQLAQTAQTQFPKVTAVSKSVPLLPASSDPFASVPQKSLPAGKQSIPPFSPSNDIAGVGLPPPKTPNTGSVGQTPVPGTPTTAATAGIGALAGEAALALTDETKPAAEVAPVPAEVKATPQEQLVKKQEEVKQAAIGATQTADKAKQTISKIALPVLKLDSSSGNIDQKYATLTDAMNKISAEVPEGKKTEINNKLSALQTDLQRAQDKAAEAKSTAKSDEEYNTKVTGYAEVADIIGQALIQLGAGVYGLKAGVDMSGVKYNRTDWSKNYDRIKADLKLRLDEAELGLAKDESRIDKNAALVRGELTKEEAKAEDKAKEQKQLLLSRVKEELAGFRDSRDIKNKEAEGRFRAGMDIYNAAVKVQNDLANNATEFGQKLFLMAQKSSEDTLRELAVAGERKKGQSDAAYEKDHAKRVADAQKRADLRTKGLAMLVAVDAISDTKQRNAQAAQAFQTLGQAGVSPKELNEVRSMFSKGLFTTKIEGGKAAEYLSKQPDSSGVQSGAPSAPSTANRAQVDRMAALNPDVPRSEVIKSLKAKKLILDDYQD